MNDLLLNRLKATTPELKDFKPSAAPAAPAAEPAPPATPAPKDTPPPADETPAGEEEGAAASAEDAPEEEIQESDSIEQQLAKLRKAQKKTLSRIDKITAERNELQRKLEEAQTGTAAPEAITSAPALKHVQSIDDLKKEDGAIANWVNTLKAHAKEGYTYRNGDGQEVTLTPEDVVEQILYWTDVRASQVPAHRQFLETRDRTRQETADKFKPWTEKKGFTAAKAEVEKTMQTAQSLLPDFDLAVHERALGRLALSDEYELVPKRKVAAGGVESAPARKTPEAPPVAPPTSGGPPIKPAGSGPDVEALRQRMLKEPGNPAAAQAYIKAKLTASRAA